MQSCVKNVTSSFSLLKTRFSAAADSTYTDLQLATAIFNVALLTVFYS